MIILIDICAGVGRYTAVASYIAPCIEVGTVIEHNAAAFLHFNQSIGSGWLAAFLIRTGKVFSANTDCATINGNRGTSGHGKRFIGFLCFRCRRIRRGCGIQRSCLIKRNQKCNSSRNGIGTADGAISSQGNPGLAVCLCIGNRLAQIVKRLSSGFKQGCLFTCEPRCDGAVAFNVQRSLCSCVDIFAIGNIVPAHELITIRRGRHYLISSHGALRVAIFLGNEFPVYCISTVFSRLERRSCINIAHQNHVGEGDLSGSTGAARLDEYFNGLVWCQFLGETGTRSNRCTTYLYRSAILFNSIVKRKGCCCRLLICNCQCGFIGCIAAASSFRAGNCTDNARTIGRPSIICVACKTQSNVLVG